MVDQQDNGQENEKKFREYLSNPEFSDEVVISGISGIYPESSNLDELANNLYNKKSMITRNKRESFQNLEVSSLSGHIPRLDKFDSGCFDTHWITANWSDPIHRLLFPICFEAILDAGINPADLVNTNTGTYVASAFNESIPWISIEPTGKSAWRGLCHTSLPSRIAYHFKFKGPAFICDSACSSSVSALDVAFKDIRSGAIDTALVCGVNICINACTTIQFQRLGVLSPDGLCKTFDQAANGYVRSEAITAVVLQRSKQAKRIYAQIVNSRLNSNGYTNAGISYPSGKSHEQLLTEIYSESKIFPDEVSYVETHGTGTAVGDLQECNALDKVLGKNRKTALPIGACKSNLGHAEPAAGLVSLTKCILILESGLIPPNLHFKVPNPNIAGLIEGRLKVITEVTKLANDVNSIIGINSFGFGGSNGHCIIKAVTPRSDGIPHDDLPRLLCVSGRTNEAVKVLLDDVAQRQINVNHIRLLQSSFSKYINCHLYRGYNIMSKNGEICRVIQQVRNLKTKPLFFVFGEINNWETIFVEFSSIPCVADTLIRIDRILSSHQYSIKETVLNPNQKVRKSFNILGSLILGIIIADILKTIKLEPTVVLGYSYGELVSAYFQNILRCEEVVNCALVLNSELEKHAVKKVNGNSNNVSKHNIIKTRDGLDKKLETILKFSKSWNYGSSCKDIRSAGYIADAVLYKNENVNKRLKTDSSVLEIGLTTLDSTDCFEYIDKYEFQNFKSFLQCLGREKFEFFSLYILGNKSAIHKLFPKVQFPVSRGTPVISSKIKWNEERSWWVFNDNMYVKNKSNKTYNINLGSKEWEYIKGHTIDGRIIFPACGYLFLVWNTLINLRDRQNYSIIFEDCRFIRATALKNNISVEVQVQILSSGYFEICEGTAVVASGKVKLTVPKSVKMVPFREEISSSDIMLTQAEIYKILRLRGYNYTGAFKGIHEADVGGKKASIKFTRNWVTFLDNLLQVKLISQYNRSLSIPVHINQIHIDVEEMNNYYFQHQTDNEAKFTTLNYNEVDTIRCCGVEIKGMIYSTITRKKNVESPVLQSYVFVPNKTVLSYETSIRVNTQIVIENSYMTKIKCVELIDEETCSNDHQIFSDIILQSFADQPLVIPDVKIISRLPLETTVKVEDKTLLEETENIIVIGSRLLKRPQMLLDAKESLTENGFIISRESKDFSLELVKKYNLNVITIHQTGQETTILLSNHENHTNSTYIEVFDDENFNWLPKVQSSTTNCKQEDLVLYSYNNPLSGLLGFMKCIRKEPLTRKVRCVLILDEDKKFDYNNELYSNQLKNNMSINIYKDGQWGTFRHLILDTNQAVYNEYYRAKPVIRGDLSRFMWYEGPPIPKDCKKVVDVYYSSINFKDVMTASGKLTLDLVPLTNWLEEDFVEGFEFAGKDANGHRIMGISNTGGLANKVIVDESLVYPVPEKWTLKQAASVVMVYSTVLYAFIERAEIRKRETVLIHSGTGGIGQAAIKIALHYQCNIFTTVGMQAKKEFLLKKFPKLKDTQIGNSRDISFEKLVMRETNGRGVDIVLNSLADEKLTASARCLAKGGRFLEIGKYDLSQNTPLNLILLDKDASFHGIFLDDVHSSSYEEKLKLNKIFKKYLNDGLIEPLNTTIFRADDLENAFRYMASGKHTGKIMVELKSEDNSDNKIMSSPRFYCLPEKSYIILGGLGGFGLELADWFVLRGSQNLILTSRVGIKTGYQKRKIDLWKSYGVKVIISTADITNRKGCQKLIKEAETLAPVGGIFNLAAVLKDYLLENQTSDTFTTTFKPKAYATKYLDEITRENCPDLDYFVIFSSISSGYGNAGQSNYGMANSVTERICEMRKKDGLPALAIQWGVIGEVGLVANMYDDSKEIDIVSTVPQKISNCMEVLDQFLKQASSAIVSSIILAAEKKISTSLESLSATIEYILGINMKYVQDTQTLSQLGMDSLSCIEIKQILEREFEIVLTTKEIRNLTFGRIKDFENKSSSNITTIDTNEEKNRSQFGQVFKMVMPPENIDEVVVKIESNISDRIKGPKILMLPGIEGYSTLLKPLAKRINAHVTVTQYDFKNSPTSVSEMAKTEIQFIERNFEKTQTVVIVAHSYGTCVALETINELEQKGFKFILICLDGAPLMVKHIKSGFPEKEDLFENEILLTIVSFTLNNHECIKLKQAIVKMSTLDKKLEKAYEFVKKYTPGISSKKYQMMLGGITRRLLAAKFIRSRYQIKQSKIVLCKATQNPYKRLPKDYGLQEATGLPVKIYDIKGDHVSILENDNLVKLINSYLNNSI